VNQWVVVRVAMSAGLVPAGAALAYEVVFLEPPGVHPSYALGVGGGQQVGYGMGPGNRALLWTGSAGGVVDLHPAGYVQSQANATDGARQGGGAAVPGATHAGLWGGTAASFVDLHPAGFSDSGVAALAGGQQVGSGRGAVTGGQTHALLWTGTAASAVDLNPPGAYESVARGTSGTRQVGFGRFSIPGGEGGPITYTHAQLWSGTAASAVDLNPPGFLYSDAWGIAGDSVVGTGTDRPGRGHALLWNVGGGANTFVDLHPVNLTGFTDSEAYAVAGGFQAGYGRTSNGSDHAMLWAGRADSAVDLHGLLPAGFGASIAYGVDADGTVVGAANNGTGWQAVMWVVPEPDVTLVFAVTAARGLLRRRRRLS
jgi:hypothetical protein